MSKERLRKWLNSLTSKNKKTIQSRVFDVLRDRKWHCRGCSYQGIATQQLAGGGGIQGLERGTKSRPGLVIESKKQYCNTCGRSVMFDRWTGGTREANPSAHIPKKLAERVLAYYNYTDAIEQRKRSAHELVIDHRFPMERWGSAEEPNDPDMSEDKIRSKFQLLKKDGSGNHNLLKSRACEECLKSGKRGAPMGIQFYYEGDERWPSHVPERGRDAERGCVGCGWYDFEKWRESLNSFVKSGGLSRD